MSSLKSARQKDKYRNKIRNWCSWILAGKTKDNLRRLRQEYESGNKAIVVEIICEVFELTEAEFLMGKKAEKETFLPSPAWERLQRRGFDDGAKVPGSHVRKIDK